MKNLLVSEWIKLHTVRVNYVLGSIAAVFPLLVIALVAALTSDKPGTARDLVGVVTGTMVLTALLLGVVGALNLTSEYSHGTIRTSFAAVPQRRNLLLAKAAVTVAATMLFSTVVEIATISAGTVILDGRGAHVNINGSDRAAMLGAVVLAGLLALLGFGLGLLIRNSAATVAVLILWPLLLEGIVRAILTVAGVKDPSPWLPYSSAVSMANPNLGDGDPGRIRSGLFFGFVVLAFIVVGLIVNERRDA